MWQQRKSGDAFTFIGNTIVTLLALSNAYDLRNENVVAVLVGGDDSLIAYAGDTIADKNRYI